MRELLRVPGAEALPVTVRRTIDACSREVLGDRRFAPWLHVYTQHRGTFLEG